MLETIAGTRGSRPTLRYILHISNFRKNGQRAGKPSGPPDLFSSGLFLVRTELQCQPSILVLCGNLLRALRHDRVQTIPRLRVRTSILRVISIYIEDDPREVCGVWKRGKELLEGHDQVPWIENCDTKFFKGYA